MADRVIVTVGASPNTDLAGPSGLEVDEEIGGFLVNAELMARSNLWSVSVTGSYTVWGGEKEKKRPEFLDNTGELAYVELHACDSSALCQMIVSIMFGMLIQLH